MIYCVICVHDYELCLREGTFFFNDFVCQAWQNIFFKTELQNNA